MEEFFYTEQMGRILLLALQEVLGEEGLNSILRPVNLQGFIDHFPPASSQKTFSFEIVSRLLGSLENNYGPMGGRGTALKVGRACFQYGLRELGSQLGLTEMSFRLLPFPRRLRTGAKLFSNLFNDFTDQRVQVEEKEGVLFWTMERCPLCWGRQTDGPDCHLAIGLFQEGLTWLSGGKIFVVEEISCIASGDKTCTFRIDPTPIS